MEKKIKVSAILAVHNEKPILKKAIQHLIDLEFDEVIVVDGASTDSSSEDIQRSFPNIICIQSNKASRSFQMNLGAGKASGDILLFTHADTLLPKNALLKMRNAISEGAVAGGFTKKYQPTSIFLTFYQMLLNNIYFGLFKKMVGTNGMFVRRDIFWSIKGYPDVDFLEDVILSQNLKKLGRIKVVRSSITVSSRRYSKIGFTKQVFKNAVVLWGFFRGESIEVLKEKYESSSKDENMRYVYSKAKVVS